MEILFEDVVGGIPWILTIILSFFVACVATIGIVLSFDIDSVDVILVILSACTVLMFLVLFSVGAHDGTTQYTVRVTDDTGYRALVEEYKIVEKKTDDIYVVEKKEGKW